METQVVNIETWPFCSCLNFATKKQKARIRLCMREMERETLIIRELNIAIEQKKHHQFQQDIQDSPNKEQSVLL